MSPARKQGQRAQARALTQEQSALAPEAEGNSPTGAALQLQPVHPRRLSGEASCQRTAPGRALHSDRSAGFDQKPNHWRDGDHRRRVWASGYIIKMDGTTEVTRRGQGASARRAPERHRSPDGRLQGSQDCSGEPRRTQQAFTGAKYLSEKLRGVEPGANTPIKPNADRSEVGGVSCRSAGRSR